ncbi:protein artichoke-like [Strongylocentrotus purpuratus]|uniref:Ig-like domain-containing protein n=1 Tax=Strongylocentrotus purpuratus TaxID=7668 RepID=A0A7M7HCD8_STRPU|nr:protein artichoke-like [Strongylocentrotus purpuratus]
MNLHIFLFVLAFIGRTVEGKCPVGCDCERVNGLVNVDCAWCGLNNVPEDIPCDAGEVDLHTNYITRLNKKSFSCQAQLSKLFLSQNKLKYIEKNVFERLMKLTYIEFESNELVSIPYLGSLPRLIDVSIFKNFFVEWPQLFLSSMPERQPFKMSLAYNKLSDAPKVPFKIWNLNLEGNTVTDLSNAVFTHPEVILELNIDKNNVEYLEKLQKMDNLTILSLEYNGIRSIADTTFAYLPSLKRINLARNKIVDVSPFRNMSYITDIILAKNSIRHIRHPAFTNIPNIAVIYLNDNEIVCYMPHSDFSVPSSLLLGRNKISVMDMNPAGNYSNVVILYIDNNHLGNFSIHPFPGLSSLYASNNFIKDVISLKYEHRFLRYINLCYNQIGSVKNFENLPALKWLFLCHNSIKTLDDNSLIDSFSLLTLDLSYNKLSELLNFTALPALRRLDLSGNILHVIGNATFDHLPRLVTLNLSQNQISKLGFFSWMPSLETLSLSHNQLRTIHPHDFSNLNNLRVLQLASNFIVEFENINLPSLQRLDIGFNFLTRMNFNHVLDHRILYINVESNRIAEVISTHAPLVSIIVNNNRIGSLNSSLLSGYNVFASSNNLTDFNQVRITPGLMGLYLYKNHLSCIPDYTFSLASSLIFLELADNMIVKVTNLSFVGLQLVRTLNLERNQIVHLPSGVFSYIGDLKTLELSGNPLTYKSSRPFMGIQGLEYLKLANMPFSNLSLHVLEDIQLVYSLNIDKNMALRQFFINKASVLPFTNFPNLRRISLSSNELRNQCPLLHIKYLQVIDLSNNLFSSIPTYCLPNYADSLNLSRNRIRSVNKDSFGELQHLWVLDLSYNRIVSFKFRALEHQKNLATLHLAGNLLTTLDISFLSFSLKSIVMDLQDNPWLCDCDLIMAVRMLESWIDDPVVCSQPAGYSNSSLAELAMSNNFTCLPQLCSQPLQTLLTFIGDQSVEIPCPIITSNLSVIIHWSFTSHRQQLPSIGSELLDSVSVLPHNALFIEHVGLNLTGTYTCWSENGAGRTKFMVNLLVEERSGTVQKLMEDNTSTVLAKNWKETLSCGNSGRRNNDRSITTMISSLLVALWQLRKWKKNILI